MLSFPSNCAVCGQPFTITHECPPRALRAPCTPPADQAAADSVTAPAVAGGGECTPHAVWWTVRYRDSEGRLSAAKYSVPEAATKVATALHMKGLAAEVIPGDVGTGESGVL